MQAHFTLVPRESVYKIVHPTLVGVHGGGKEGPHYKYIQFLLLLLSFDVQCKLFKDSFVYYSVHPGSFPPQALRLSHASLAETTTGQIVNLVTNDVQRLESVNSSIAKLGPTCVNDFHD